MDQQKEIRASSTYREALAKGAHAAIMLRVRDEAGNSVSNAQVNVVLDMPSNPLASAGTTDATGVRVLEELTGGAIGNACNESCHCASWRLMVVLT